MKKKNLLKFFSSSVVFIFILANGIFFSARVVAAAPPPPGYFHTRKIDSSVGNGPTLANSDNFGRSVTDIGDLNGDGVDDIAVGAPLDDTGGTNDGAVYIHFMDQYGNVISTTKIDSATTNGPALHTGDEFGFSVASIPDFDNNGSRDLIVGAPFDDNGGATNTINKGAIYVLQMNSDGSVSQTTKIDSTSPGGPTLSNGDEYGYSIAPIHNDPNGFPTILVGAPFDDANGANQGVVYIEQFAYNGTTNTLSFSSNDRIDGSNGPTLHNNDNFGAALANIGDIDGDGVPDFAIGAPMDDTGGTNRGAVYIDLTTLGRAQMIKIDSLTANGPALNNGDMYGSSIAGAGYYNNDAIPDIAVGAPMDDTNGTNRGAIYISTLNADGTAASTPPSIVQQTEVHR